MVKGKHKPPSRQRYEQSHPVVAIRVNQQLYKKLQEIKAQGNVSFADILKEGLGIQEAATKEAFNAGYDAGETEGKRFDLGTCYICKKHLHWDLGKAKERQLLEQAINNAKYIHATCKK